MPPEMTTEQAPVASVQDRVASIFSPQPKQAKQPAEAPPSQSIEGNTFEQPQETEAANEPASPEGEPAAPVEETFELEVDGEKYVLPKKLEKGYLQEKDYTQKSQGLAEQRKQVELIQEQARIAQMQHAFTQTLGPELQQLNMLDAVLEQAKSIDWNSMSAEQMLRKKLEIDGWKDQRDGVSKAIEAKRGEFLQQQQGEIEALKAKSLDALKKRIPAWSDDLMKQVRSHALSDGYTESELGSILDPRHVVTLWKAQQFDQLQAKAQPAVAAAKVVKTTPSNPMPKHVKEKLAFHKVLQKAPQGSPERKHAVEDRVASIFSR